ncbi:MAG: hypothetical protein COB51_00085 [Moraxellaceae bacterium]|nr:MAG: hypothetical protein COB51_00085 [Moraxellaceae bacterium]
MIDKNRDVIPFLSCLRNKNIFIELNGEKLKINAPKGAITAEIKAELIEKKPHIIAFLQQAAVQSSDAIDRVDRSQPMLQSYSQERLWFLSQLDNNASYHIAKALRVKGPLDKLVLRQVFTEIVRRHESLRTRFASGENGEALQIIDPPKPFLLDEVDLCQAPDKELKAPARQPKASAEKLLAPAEQIIDQARQLAKQESEKLFDLEKGSLFRVVLIKLDDEDHLLLLTLHHIIADGGSLEVLVNEIAVLYAAFGQRLASPLPELKIQYADYSAWKRTRFKEEEIKDKVAFWADVLNSAPDVISLPTDRPRPAEQSYRGETHHFEFPKSLVERLKGLASNQEVTLFMLLLAAYQIALGRWAQQDDVCIGVPVAGRDHPLTKSLIGFFVNGLVMRGDMSGNPSLEEYLARIKQFSIQAFENQDVPNELVLAAINLRRDAAFNPGAQVGFSLQTALEPQIQNLDKANFQALSNIAIEAFDNQHSAAIQDITLSLIETKDGIGGRFDYAADLFDAQSIERFAERYVYLLGEMAARPTESIHSLALVSKSVLLESLDLNPEAIERILPLTPMQRDFYVDMLLNPDTLQNSMGYCGFFNETLDVQAWQNALDRLVAHEPMMRVEFVGEALGYGEIAYQCIKKSKAYRFNLLDWREQQLDREIVNQRVHQLVTCTYELSGPLFHHHLIRISDDCYAIAAAAHHIVGDGMALSAHGQKLVAFYQANNDEPLEMEGDTDFFDVIYDNRNAMDRRQTLEFWQQQFSTVEPLSFSAASNDLSTGKMSIDDTSADNADGAEEDPNRPINLQRMLPRDHWQAVKKYCRSQRITPALFYKCLYGLLLKQYCQADQDFEVVEFNSGRTRANYLSVGVYYQQQPFIFSAESVSGEKPFKQLLSYARQFQKSIKPFHNLSISKKLHLSQPGPVAFTYNYYHFIPELEFQGEKLETVTFTAFADHAVQFLVKQIDDDLHLSLEYRNSVFQSLDFLDRIVFLSEQIVAQPDLNLQDLKFVLEQEQEYLLQLNQDSQRPLKAEWTSEQSVAQLFELQVVRSAETIAVKQGSQSLTYLQLNSRANQLAHYLRGQGITRNSRVGICLDRSTDTMVAVLAVLKAGGAYVPMDSQYPPERLAYLLKDSAAPMLITQSGVAECLQEVAGQQFLMDRDWGQLENLSDTNPQPINEKDDLIYVVYTSGSTGEPKGAAVKHRGELNLLSWYVRQFGFDQSSRVLIISAFGFDLTQKNLFAPLVSGGQLILPEVDHYDERAFAEIIETEKVTLINCAPSAFYPLVEQRSDQEISFQQLSSLRQVIFGGEPIRMNTLQAWLENEFNQAQVTNNYGPTECTDIAAFFHVQDPQRYYQHAVPVGRANDNVQLYLLNDNQQMLPQGLIGELCISGEGVGEGYLNKEQLSNAVFIDNPYGDGLLYRTGDLMRQLASGDYEFIGRKDFQVKIRGLRIELGEIEWALRQQPGVEDSLVLALDDSLVGYVIGDVALDQQPWRTLLGQYLPDYMVPNNVLVLPQWPLTPNGKIDRKALPQEAGAERVYLAPRNDTEQRVAQVWKEILGLEKVSVEANFFELGGNSLLAMRILSRLEKDFAAKFRLSMLFNAQSVADVATLIDQELHPSDWSPVVSIRQQKAAKNLFMIHPVGGTVFCYQPLAQELNGVNVYGLQASGLEEHQSLYASFESMASYYIESIKQVQPRGPYLLGGQSLGGLIAWEITQQLEAQGETVENLYLIDSYDPKCLGDKLAEESQSALVIEQFGAELDIKEQDLAGLDGTSQVTLIYNRARDRGLVADELGLSQVQRVIAVGKANAEAMRVYQLAVYSGNVLHVAASESRLGVNSGDAWSAYATHHLVREQLTADHESILQAPQVARLAALIQSTLL